MPNISITNFMTILIIFITCLSCDDVIQEFLVNSASNSSETSTETVTESHVDSLSHECDSLHDVTVVDPLQLPLAQFSDITDKFIGAFKTNVGPYGSGQIAYNPDNNSLFITGHIHDFSIGEYEIPALVNNVTDASVLNTTVQIQRNTKMLDKIPLSTWPNSPIRTRIQGMQYHNGKLIVNGAVYYAGPEDTNTTFRVEAPSNLASSAVVGNFEIEGAHHTTSWWFEIPQIWRSIFNNDTHILGSGLGRLAIHSRLSIGPTLFTANIDDFMNATSGDPIATTAFMDFSLTNKIVEDMFNVGGATNGINNDIHTSESKTHFGFIVPGTRTYAVIGASGGHQRTGSENPYAGLTQESSTYGTIYYKDTEPPLELRPNSAGEVEDGYSIYNAEDKGARYWLFDLDKIIKAQNLHDILPYESAYFADVFPHDKSATKIPSGTSNSPRSGTWDPINKRLFLSWLFSKPNEKYESDPIITVYKFD